MDIDKALAALEFQSKGLVCETRRVLWTRPGSRLPAELAPAEHDPEGCQNYTHSLFYVRLCPCWNDPRKFVDTSKLTFASGLLVCQVMLCDAHERYFRDYLNYPFVCPGCGIHFESAEEILLGEQNIEETP